MSLTNTTFSLATTNNYLFPSLANDLSFTNSEGSVSQPYDWYFNNSEARVIQVVPKPIGYVLGEQLRNLFDFLYSKLPTFSLPGAAASSCADSLKNPCELPEESYQGSCHNSTVTHLPEEEVCPSQTKCDTIFQMFCPDNFEKLHHSPKEESTECLPKSLVTTWGVTLKELKQHHPIALAWLKCCAYLDPTAIPEKVLTKWLGMQSNLPSNNLKAIPNPKDLLGVLQQYHLISWDITEDHLSLHRQMQELLRCENKDSVESDLIEVMKALGSSFTGRNGTAEELKYDFSLLPHFEATLIHTHALKELSLTAKKTLTKTLLNTGSLRLDTGSYLRAATLLEQSLGLSISIWGETSIEVAESLHYLGSVYKALGQYDKAIKFHEQSRRIREKVHGKNHPDVATSLQGLGNVYGSQGQDDRAIKFFEQSLEIFEKVLGKNHPKFAESLNNLAASYNAKGHYHEAIKLLERSLEIFLNSLGDSHPKVATCLRNLGASYYALEQYDKAIKFLEQALEIYRNALGDSHPDVATCLSNLGNAYYALEQYDKVFEYDEQALEILEKALGKDHPLTKLVCKNLEVIKKEHLQLRFEEREKKIVHNY